jgi:hypothetical protein
VIVFAVVFLEWRRPKGQAFDDKLKIKIAFALKVACTLVNFIVASSGAGFSPETNRAYGLYCWYTVFDVLANAACIFTVMRVKVLKQSNNGKGPVTGSTIVPAVEADTKNLVH